MFISRHILHQHWYTCPNLLNAVETCSIEVYLTVVSAISASSIQRLPSNWEPLSVTNISHPKQQKFYEYPSYWVRLPTENAQQNTPQALPPFWLWKPSSEHEHARLLPRMLWNWTVLLPSDTYRKHITSITAVSLPFVTYLLTLRAGK
jgi:hypothetical protein